MRKAEMGRVDVDGAGMVKEHRETLNSDIENQEHNSSPPPSAESTPVHLLGLSRSCWRCHVTLTALVAMMEVGGDLFSEDLVLCETDEALALAWDHLSAEARSQWNVGEVAYRSSKAAGTTYLANGCAACGAIVGAFPLFHEDVPEALATHGTDAFVVLATVDMPSQLFDLAYDSRWE